MSVETLVGRIRTALLAAEAEHDGPAIQRLHKLLNIALHRYTETHGGDIVVMSGGTDKPEEDPDAPPGP